MKMSFAPAPSFGAGMPPPQGMPPRPGPGMMPPPQGMPPMPQGNPQMMPPQGMPPQGRPMMPGLAVQPKGPQQFGIPGGISPQVMAQISALRGGGGI